MSYGGVTPNMRMQMQMPGTGGYGFNPAFNPGAVQIQPTSYINPKTTVHNNLNDNVELEQIESLHVIIDGYHRRNHTTDTNPYKFIVDFGQEPSLESTVGGITTKINPKGVYLNNGDGGLHRVKFVKIRAITVPRYSVYNYDFGGVDDFAGTTELTSSVRYVVLKVKELADEKKVTSGDFLSNNSFFFRYDKTLGGLGHLYCPMMNDTVTYQTPLVNLKRLSIRLYDDADTQLTLPTLTYADKSDSDNAVSREFDFDAIIAELEAAKGKGINPFTGGTSDNDIDGTITQINAVKRRHQLQIFMDIGVATKAISKIVDYNH